MIVTKPIGTLSDYKNYQVDFLDVEWYVVHKAIDRRNSRNGMDIGVRMDDETKHRGWHQDDVIYKDDEKVVAINILPCKCICVDVQGYSETVKLCYEIGNRHAPLFYGENKQQFLTPYEAPILIMVEKLGLNAKIKEGRLLPSNRISSAQGNGHSHSHGHPHEH